MTAKFHPQITKLNKQAYHKPISGYPNIQTISMAALIQNHGADESVICQLTSIESTD